MNAFLFIFLYLCQHIYTVHSLTSDKLYKLAEKDLAIGQASSYDTRGNAAQLNWAIDYDAIDSFISSTDQLVSYFNRSLEDELMGALLQLKVDHESLGKVVTLLNYKNGEELWWKSAKRLEDSLFKTPHGYACMHLNGTVDCWESPYEKKAKEVSYFRESLNSVNRFLLARAHSIQKWIKNDNEVCGEVLFAIQGYFIYVRTLANPWCSHDIAVNDIARTLKKGVPAYNIFSVWSECLKNQGAWRSWKAEVRFAQFNVTSFIDITRSECTIFFEPINQEL